MARFGSRLWVAAASAAFGVLTLSSADQLAATGAGAPSPPLAAGRSPSGIFDHRYKVVGKVRLALFWASRDVGSARLTLGVHPDRTALALLAGSDPIQAPRRLNQWTYLREETRGDRASVFAVRSLDEIDGSASTPLALGRGPCFSVSCASVSESGVTSRATTVQADSITYRMFPQMLDRVPAAPAWQWRDIAQPPAILPGFLTALHRLMERDAADWRAGDSAPLTYVYNGALYDLTVRDRKVLGKTTVGQRTFRQLTRTELVIRNRATTAMTKFSVTHTPDLGLPTLPVQILIQPSFWLAIELRLDDVVDAPEEPSVDPATLARLREICD